MTNAEKYTFSDPFLGHLTLEIEAPKKQVFSQNVEFQDCRAEGLPLIEPPSCAGLFFFEWQRIHFSFVAEDNSSIAFPLELRINDRCHQSSESANGKIHMLTGSFDFKNSVGLVKIELRDAASKLVFSLNTEVFPQKMDYNSDYKAMIGEISHIVKNLTYDMLKDTYRKSRPRKTGVSTHDEWWNILDALFDDLLTNLGVITRMAKHEIHKYDLVQPVERIKNTKRRNQEWFSKNSRYRTQNGFGLNVGGNSFSHAPTIRKIVTYDTWENRFVVWAIEGLIKKLGIYKYSFPEIAGRRQAGQYQAVIDRINRFQGKLQGVLHNSPFNEVSRFEKRTHFSTSLTRGAGYRDFMRIYLLLNRGLDLADNGIFKIGQKDISLLYEYWCFLKLVQLINEVNSSDISYQDLIKVKAGKIRVELAKGKESEVVFTDQKTKQKTSIYFNRSFSKSKRQSMTFSQIPDLSISFKKEGYEKPFWYLFDAKYRFDEEVRKDNQSYNVPEDAIGQLHRYRDAILHSDPGNTSYRQAIKSLGGVILFPFPLEENQFLSNPFFKSLDEMNIGALPFLPGKTRLAKRFLKDLLNCLPEKHYEGLIRMDDSEYLANRKKWNEWVTIGVLPNKKGDQEARIKFLKSEKIYHLPFVKDLDSRLYMTKKVLVCFGGRNHAFLYNVLKWEILTSNELESKGATWDLSHERYVAFHLSEPLDEIKTPEKLAPISYRYASLQGLKLYLNELPTDKNYFYLTNPDAARLYKELKNSGIDCKIKWTGSKSDPTLIEFRIDEFKIRSSIDYPYLKFKIDNSFKDLNEILKILEVKDALI